MRYNKEKGIVEIDHVRDFHPAHTFLCGQCFRWTENSDGSFDGIAYKKAVNVSFSEGTLIIKNTTEDDFNNIWSHYLDLGRDYTSVKEILSSDTNLKNAIEYGYGIRILNQEPWECLISFIISTQNQIPRIKKIVNSLSEGFGNKILIEDRIYYTFPDADALKGLCEEDLGFLKAGYRAGYIIDAVKKITSGEICLEKIFDMDYPSAKKELMKIKGVGEKVADCVLLFSYGKTEAFPIDVWVGRIMRNLYLSDEASIKDIREESERLFGKYAGIAQQYLFYYARENNIQLNDGK
ncbi:MAG: DNA-3-methyladenine glycosylase 2 family protein [Ruminococcaceae bacterium]|nr:DNA-3-methyladenine glycosylase 2 family protein [Oscillospiraceae bacterium]